MRIVIDIRPIEKSSNSLHKVRGVGKYITLLVENLEKYDKENNYFFVSDPLNTRADIIHYPYFDPFFITLPFLKKTKTVVTVHDVIPLIHKKHFPVGIRGELKWQLNKRLLRKVDAIITDSKASKEDIEKVVGISPSKIFPVYLAADSSFRQLNLKKEEVELIHQKYNLPEKFFLYVGDVTWNKNLPKLIEAIEKVKIPLVMVGKALVEKDLDKSNPWNMDRVIVDRKTESNTLFIKLGFVPNEDLVKLYNLAIGLVMPSLDEGFGLPVLEAMQSGCPVITTKFGSLPEVGGDAVLYADALSPEDIAKKISLLFMDTTLRKKLSNMGKKRAVMFSLEKMMSETIDVYTKV